MKPTQFRTLTKGYQSRRLLPKLGFAPLRRYQISGTQCVVEGTPPPQEVKIYCRSPFTIVGSTRSLTGISTVYFVLSGGDVTATTYERKHIAQKVPKHRVYPWWRLGGTCSVAYLGAWRIDLDPMCINV